VGILESIENELSKAELDLDKILFNVRIDTKRAFTQANLTRAGAENGTRPRPPVRHKDSSQPAWTVDPETSIRDRMVLALHEGAYFIRDKTPFNGPLWLMSHFLYTPAVFYNESKLVSRRLANLTKLLDFTEKCLVKANLIQSQKQIMSHDGSRKMCSDMNGLEIFILTYDEENNRKKFKAV
jgi:hypothetical protein